MNKKVAIFHPDQVYAEDLRLRLVKALPVHDIQLWHKGFDARYLLAWKPCHACLENADLEVVFSLGAGVDAFIYNKNLPAHLKIARLEEAGMGNQMLEFALYGILYYSRGFDVLHQAQREKKWKGISTPKKMPFKTKVGVMGLGQLGAFVAEKLANIGYPVVGYSRSHKRLKGVMCFDSTKLDDFLAQSEVLICLLPLTDETRGILNVRLFQKLPHNAFLINLARGAHLVEQDLTVALDCEYLSGALLDVFQTEPLPLIHPFWEDKRIVITPHLSAITTKAEAIEQISANILRYDKGEALRGLVDRAKQY